MEKMKVFKVGSNVQMKKEKPMQIETIEFSSETRDERLTKLRGFLADELKSDNPGLLYVQDLRDTIKYLEI